MAATIKDDLLPRSVMFLCLGAALLLVGVQWRTTTNSAKALHQPTKAAAPNQRKLISATPARVDLPDAKAMPLATPKEDPNLLVDLSDRRVYLYKDQRLITSYPVAVGQDGWETPAGSFRVMHKQRNPAWQHPITKEIVRSGPANPLGRRWIGFWFDGQTEIGFHGTNQEELVGQAVSHGCLRMRNQDVEQLYEQVPEGTIVVVRP